MLTLEAVLEELEGSIRHHLRAFAWNQELWDDLYQESRLAIVEAFPAYDPDRSKPATFFRYCIRNAILHYMRDKYHSVRVPAYLQERGAQAPRVESLEAAVEHAPDDACLVDEYDVVSETLAKVYWQRVFRWARLSLREGEQVCRLVLGPHEGPLTGAEHASLRAARRKLREAMASLAEGAN